MPGGEICWLFMRTRIVLQARMGSQRRPGKTLADIGGRPLLERCLERLAAVVERGRSRWELLVATSTAPGDDAVARLAEQLGYRSVRGSEENVLSRYVLATNDLADEDLVIRATADNPLYDVALTHRLVAEHLASHNDYTGLDPLSPSVPEVLRVRTLRAVALRNDLDDYCREHVTPFFRREWTPFKAVRLPPTWSGLDPSIRLTVDTPEDIAFMNRLYRTLIGLTGEDRPATWTQAQIYGTARGLAASAAADHGRFAMQPASRSELT
jgi:spore coat polysaccharide biosynthesis protein SpsF